MASTGKEVEDLVFIALTGNINGFIDRQTPTGMGGWMAPRNHVGDFGQLEPKESIGILGVNWETLLDSLGTNVLKLSDINKSLPASESIFQVFHEVRRAADVWQ